MNKTAGPIGLICVSLLALGAWFLHEPVDAERALSLGLGAAQDSGRGDDSVSHNTLSPGSAHEPGLRKVLENPVYLPDNELYEEATLGGRLRAGRRVQVTDSTSGKPLPFAMVTWIDGADHLGAELAKVKDELLCSVLSDWNPERYVLTLGTTYQADKDGELFLPAEIGLAMGRSQELWLVRELRDDPSVPCELALEPDTSITVKLLGYLGEPAGDIVIELIEKVGYEPNPWAHAVTGSKTGEAVLPHLGVRLKAIASGLVPQIGIKGEFLLGAIVHTPEPFFLPIDKDNPPTETITWTLPATGSIEVSVHFPNGELVRDKELYTDLLRTSEDDSRFPGSYVSGTIDLPQADGKGWTRYGHVGLGLEFEVPIYSNESGIDEHVEIDGPTFPGELIAVRVEVPYSYPSLTFVLLDELGVPMPAGSLIQVDMSLDSDRHAGRKIRVGNHGACRLKSEGYPHMAEASQVELEVKLRVDERQRAGRTTFTPSFIEGEMDLGTIRMELSTMLASGIVTDPLGAPLAGARVTAKPMLKSAEGTWVPRRILEQPSAWTDAEGRFKLHSTGDWQGIQVQANHRDFVSAASETLAVGATDAAIQLGSSGAIAGRVLCSSHVLPSSIQIVASPTRNADGTTAEGGLRIQTANRDGSFAFQHISPGTYSVSVRLRNWAEPYFEVQELVVAKGETNRDVRLQAIDLREMQTLTITVLDEAGQPIPEGEIGLRPASGPGSDRPFANYSFSDGLKVILVESGAFDLMVSAERYHAIEAYRVEGGITVHLAQWNPVVLYLDLPNLDLQEGWKVYFWLEREQGDSDYQTKSWTERFDREGRAELWAAETGEWRVYLELENPDGYSDTMSEDPIVIQLADIDGTQQIQVPVTQAAIDAAVARMLED